MSGLEQFYPAGFVYAAALETRHDVTVKQLIASVFGVMTDAIEQLAEA